MKSEISKIVIGLAEYYDKNLSPSQIKMYVEDLSNLTPEQLLYAVKKYRQDPKSVFFPLPAKLIGLIVENDGRPGVEEAWSMCPKDEFKSVYLNDEIMSAWSAANSILKETNDKIAARMAFKEVYENILNDHRNAGISPKWFLSSGYDRLGREAALKEAVEKNRLTIQAAQKIIPEIEFKQPKMLELVSDQNNDAQDIRGLILSTFKGM